jgi:KRAB domain-containing zinc finger protein
VEIEDIRTILKIEYDADLNEDITGIVCQFCPAVLPSEYHMQDHLTERHPLDFQCGRCNLKFRSGEDLQEHLQNHPEAFEMHEAEFEQVNVPFDFDVEYREENNPIALPIRNLNVKTRSMGPPEEIENAVSMERKVLNRETRTKYPLFACCGRNFFHQRTLDNHVTIDHRFKFECNECKYVFYKKIVIQKHMKSHFYAYKCPICYRKFVNENIVEKHKRNCKRKWYRCATCGKIYKCRSNLRAHKRHKHLTRFLCGFCAKYCPSKAALIIHERSHSGERPYVCDFCNSTFMSRSHITTHIKKHFRTKDEECHICHKKFYRKAILTNHIRTHDPKSRKFSCQFCGQKFLSNHNLKSHYKTHTEVKEFKCDLCPSEFKSKGGVTYHLRAVHARSIEKKYLCSLCGFKFFNNFKLQLHINTHTEERPYKCDICDRGFNQPYALTSHKTLKHKILPYVCSKCGLGFRVKSEMMSHITIH